jgi:hypothetical protein
MIALFALIALQAAPPPPPPNLKMAAPVAAFWQERTISDAERRNLRDVARVLVANDLLARAEEDWSRRPAHRGELLEALIARLQVLLPYTSLEENQRADLCAAGALVGSLTPEEITDVAAFFRSPAGRRFWSTSRIVEKSLVECYKIGMLGSLDPGAVLRSVGLRPPAQWDGPPVD